MSTIATTLLANIKSIVGNNPVRIMNVCGGHERAISKCGLRSVLPETLELIPGPGCPVCICPEEDLYAAIQLALTQPVILLTYADMLRVPVNAGKGEVNTLEQAREQGADIRAINSPLQAMFIANENPDKQVVFFAIGFETTAAPTAALVAAGIPSNLSILLSARLTAPAVRLLLESGQAQFDLLLAPGHVASIMGAEQWRFVAESFAIPVAIAGFTPEWVLAAIYQLLQQCRNNPRAAQLLNCYPGTVTAQGNLRAQQVLQQVFSVLDANWRGIGTLTESGYALRPAYQNSDARMRFGIRDELHRKRRGQMPPGCACAQVVLGQTKPDACPLYGKACIPAHPLGPCMVSDEGACHIWWQHQISSKTSQANNVLA